MSAQELITEHLDLWTSATTHAANGRGKNGKVELTGIQKLRELILELAIRGKLVEQNSDDEPVSVLFDKIEQEKQVQVKAKTIRKPKELPAINAAEYPFPIPANWQYCRLNDIGVWGSGATPRRGNTSYYGGGIPWLKSGELYQDFVNTSEETITDLAIQETSVRMNNPGDVLIAMYGATIGKASILNVPGTTNQAVCACTPWPGISNKFLLLLLKAYRSRFVEMGAGGAQPNISREKIIGTVLGLPPEQEQHRIVQKVDELMALCDRLEQQTSDQLEAHETLVDTLLNTLTQSENATELADNWARLAAHFDTLFTTEQSIDKLKQTILELAVMGRLVEQSPDDDSALSLLEKISSEKKGLIKEGSLKKKRDFAPISEGEKLFTLPAGWEWARLKDVFINIVDCPHSTPKFVESGKTCLDTNSFKAGKIIPSKVRCVSDETFVARNNRLKPEPNDIVFAREGSVGESVVIPEGLECCLGQRVMLFRPSTYTNPHFLRITLSNPLALETLLSMHKGIGAKHVNVSDMRGYVIALPPEQEQDRIVRKVDELMAFCDQLKERLSRTSEIRCQLAEAVVEGALN
ncbi:restriction endonuclease subunit S [Halovibrio salipaludis]|uniref:Restriction endonuclease subunit S n=1 Tax=Halovibrio salipaludis TaxID=2032626 RepID=A0A2A2EZ11_9GAMM|nr:restriction endonuclease subunit S [Halovibrio salipaludis]PAU78621.1 restriction endonuclease subunit S [Halovibrio salipaludis]